MLVFHVKNLFIFTLLVCFTQTPTIISTLISMVGRECQLNQFLTITFSLISMFLILTLGYWIIKKIGVTNSNALFVKKNVLLIVVGYVTMQISSNFLLFLEGNQGVAPNINIYKNIPGVLLFLSIGFVTPILEEIVFRGFLMGYWFKHFPLLGMFINIIIFTILHGPKTIFSLLLFVGTSVIFGTIYLKSKRLEVSSIVHILNNLPAAIQLLLL